MFSAKTEGKNVLVDPAISAWTHRLPPRHQAFYFKIKLKKPKGVEVCDCVRVLFNRIILFEARTHEKISTITFNLLLCVAIDAFHKNSE